jgi:hypothetical protein
VTFEYFTLEELRARPDLSDTSQYPNAALEEAHDYVVGIIEREVGAAFVARTVTNELHDGNGHTGLLLDWGYVRSVTSATVDGVAVTGLQERHGVLYRLSGSTPIPWPVGLANVSVTYAHGYSAEPPKDVKYAALKAARAYLLTNASDAIEDDRRTSLSTEMGVLNFMVASSHDNPTGYPEVDATIVGWRDRLDVTGFA